MHFRNDIQVLRGWAVSIVVLDHVKLGPFHSGFLGVDIFFVLSGFLITTIILRDLDRGTFSFKEFYLRRARRILPAAYVTAALTSLGAIWFMTSIEFNDLRDQIIGAVTFTINFVLMGQTDYFANEASSKPLLHLWSLAIEEQFYLLLPAVLFFCPSRWRHGAIVVLAIFSMAACAVLVLRGNLTEAFYLSPVRAWELLIGSAVAAFAVPLAQYQRLWAALFWPAVLTLAFIPLATIMYHPGPQALVVCLCTAVVILARNNMIGRLMPLRRLGDISYSLYLVHWPITVFAFSSYFGEPTIALKMTIIGLSLVSAMILYAGVEQPARTYFIVPNWKAVGASLIGAGIVLGAQSIAETATKPNENYASLRKTNYGISQKCNYRNAAFQPTPECASSETPNVIVWGDSFAMHLVNGLVDAGIELRQATFSACAPVPGQAIYQAGRYDKEWGNRCIAFNDDVILHIEKNAYDVVFIGSALGTIDGNAAHIRNDAGDLIESDTNFERSFTEFAKAVKRLRASGNTVVLAEPPPNGGFPFHVANCGERLLSGKFIFGPNQDCRFSLKEYENRAAEAVEFVNRAERELDLPILRISDVLCDEERCNVIVDGTLIFRDASHLSKAGSTLVMQRIDLKKLMTDHLPQF